METPLPPIPAKRYFTIGEVAELCCVKPHVLRYWEQEFSQLRPMKRRGNRRYYQHHEVLLVRRIRALLHDQGFTISGARNRLSEQAAAAASADDGVAAADTPLVTVIATTQGLPAGSVVCVDPDQPSLLATQTRPLSIQQMRQELLSIRGLLTV